MFAILMCHTVATDLNLQDIHQVGIASGVLWEFHNEPKYWFEFLQMRTRQPEIHKEK